jgi:hypothetical protein
MTFCTRSRALLGLLLLVSSGCHRAEIELDFEEAEGGAPSLPNTPAAGARVFDPLFSGNEPRHTAPLGSERTPSRLLAECQQPLEALQAECVFLGRAVCKQAPIAGELRACVGPCAVCREQLRDYPHYFEWHPCCEAKSCASDAELTECDARCPPPSEHDQVAPCSLGEGP